MVLIVGKVKLSEIKKIKNVNVIIKKNKNRSIENIKEEIDIILSKKIKLIPPEDRKKFLTDFLDKTEIDINFYLGIVYTEFDGLYSYKEKSQYPFYDGKTVGIFSRSKVYNLLKNKHMNQMEIIEKYLRESNKIKYETDAYTIGYLHSEYNYKGADSKIYLIDFKKNNCDRLFFWEMNMRKEIQKNNEVTFHQVMNGLIGHEGLCYLDSKGVNRWTKSRTFFYKYGLNTIFKILKEESEEGRNRKLKRLWY